MTTKKKLKIIETSSTLTQTEALIYHDADATNVLCSVEHPTPLNYPNAVKQIAF